MNKKKLVKRLIVIPTLVTLVFSIKGIVYASTQALPNGTIVDQNGAKYLTDSKGEKYSGWFIDSKEDWYYFKDSNKVMKTGWHQDDKDGYWYYLNLSNGKMVMGWQTIDGKDYYFQPVKDMGNYHFNNEQEKWFYSINSNVPYGAMYMDTTTPDGSTVDMSGAKVTTKTFVDNNAGISNTVKNGWILENGKWYYYSDGSILKDKWLNLDKKWYYIISDGTMAYNGWYEVGEKSYYFGFNGVMYVDTTTPDGSRVDENGAKIVNNIGTGLSVYGNLKDFIGKFDFKTSTFNDYGTITILDISEHKIYGTMEYFGEGSFIADFTNGVTINEDNTFAITGVVNSGDIVDGSDIWSYELAYRNGKPVIYDVADGDSYHKYFYGKRLQ